MNEATISLGTCSMNIEYCGDCPYENTEKCDFGMVSDEEEEKE